MPQLKRDIRWFLGCLLLLGAALSAHAQIDGQRFEQDVRAIARPQSRIAGSEGYAATVQYVTDQLRQLPRVEVQTQSFPLMVPVTMRAEMSYTAADGSQAVANIYPFWPASTRVNSTPAEGITGRLVYIADATYEKIPPAALAGQIAVVESTSAANWTQAFYFGARAVIVLGGPSLNHADLRAHDVLIPINLPRFFIPDGPLAEELRAGRITQPATLLAQVRWEQKSITNIYALVRPGENAPAAGRNSAAFVVGVPLDASGLVPDLAGGASQAVQTAAGLAMLRDLNNRPLDRPVMVCFTGGDSIQLRGARELFMTFADPPALWREELEQGSTHVPGLLKQQSELERDLQRARAAGDDPTQFNVTADRSLIDRITKIIELEVAIRQDELFRIRIKSRKDLSEQMLAREQRLSRERIDLSTLGFAIGQSPKTLGRTWLPSARTQEQVAAEMAGQKLAPPTKLEESLLPAAKVYMARAIDRMTRLQADLNQRRQQLERRIELYQWLAGRLNRDANPSRRSNNSRLIETYLALDLSDHGNRFGAITYGNFYRANNISQVMDWRQWLDRQKSKSWFEEIRASIDVDTMSGVRAPQTWLAAPLALSSELGMAWGVPAMGMTTVNDLRLVRDTPADTLANLRLDVIEPQLAALHRLFSAAVNDLDLKTQVEFKWQRNSFSGQVVSPAAGRPVPDLPREGFLATYYYAYDRKGAPVRNIPWTLGVRRNEVAGTDAEGKYRFEGLLKGEVSEAAKQYLGLGVEVFRIADDGSITAATDIGKQSADIKLWVDLKRELEPVRSLVFNCEELALVGLYDPRFLQDLGELTILDARRNAEPQRYNFFLVRQMMVGLVEPGQRSDLLFRYGRAGNRLILVNADLQKKGNEFDARPRGFTAQEIAGIPPLALVTSQDFYKVDHDRLTDYASKGVKSDLIDSLHATASEQLKSAEQAMARNDGQAFMREATGAWANESRVYLATRDMANDVVRAAIFLLLLCIPFAFCMERLLIGTPNIYKQIGGVAGLFAIMAIALASFHPAFQISTSPLIIILAFAIIFMSLVVIFVVYGRFDTELKKLRSGRGSAVGTSFARASVLMSAVLLGIANMRRRKFRTALTSVTVILITFAVLCFTSASRYVGTTTLPTGVPRQYSGLMLRQRGFRPIPQVTLDNLRSVLDGFGQTDPGLAGHRRVVQHWWNVNAGDPKEQIYLTPVNGAAPADQGVSLQAVLGLSPGESNLSSIAEVVPDGGYAQLEQGRNDVVYIGRNLAEQVKVRDGAAVRNLAVGDQVKLAGIELQVAGIFDPVDFDARVRSLGGEPITPLDYVTNSLDASGKNLKESAADDLTLEADQTSAELSSIYTHLSAGQIAIVPASVSRILPNASLRSLAFRLKDQAEVEQVGEDLTRRFAMAMFAGYDDGVRMMAASNLSDVQGGAAVAIPLAIAGLIIFNTMMGSIAERRREIHVYTSLGLAPMHVGALFLAEAMTYGLIGTVFGYVIGQGVGKLLSELGWLGQVTLNYSGTSAMMTMGLILVIVLLSALVPARLASKIAAPSIDRNWRVPLPKGDEIIANLPFTINRTAADGVLAYLAEYFDAHQEGSIGKFSAGKVDFFMFEDDKGRFSRGLKTTIWLTPFDLGIRQHLMLLVHPGQFEDIYEVQVVLQRLSGDDGSWYRMNRTFLTELRKQFLQWRSLSPQRMLDYVVQSKQLFSNRPAENEPADSERGVAVG